MSQEGKRFCVLINEAIEDEDKAKEFYARVKQSIGKEYEGYPQVIKMLEGLMDLISEAESGHKRIFEMLKSTLCEIK